MPTDANGPATTVKNINNTKINVVSQKQRKNKLKVFKMVLETETVAPKTQCRTEPITTKTVIEGKGSKRQFTQNVRHLENQTFSQSNANVEPASQWIAFSEKMIGRTESGPARRQPQQFNKECSNCSPKIQLEKPRLRSEPATDRLETTKTILPSIQKVVCQQCPETKVSCFS